MLYCQSLYLEDRTRLQVANGEPSAPPWHQPSNQRRDGQVKLHAPPQEQVYRLRPDALLVTAHRLLLYIEDVDRPLWTRNGGGKLKWKLRHTALAYGNVFRHKTLGIGDHKGIATTALDL